MSIWFNVGFVSVDSLTAVSLMAVARTVFPLDAPGFVVAGMDFDMLLSGESSRWT